MPIHADDLRVLHRFIGGVMDRPAASKVQGIALALLGGIVWRGQPGTIEVKDLTGSADSVLWVAIGGKRYAFTYNRQTLEIELRDRTQTGPALHRFTNATPVGEVEAIFRHL